MNNLIKIIQCIVNKSSELKDKFTDASSAPVEFACIFCQNDKEYEQFTSSIETLGEIVETTQSGFTYLLDKPIKTNTGPLRLVKIRKPDLRLTQKGDADFNTNYKSFKAKYQGDPQFELVKKAGFEFLRLSSPDFNVMTCFSNIPKSEYLGIKL